jgi:hypothetical protein
LFKIRSFFVFFMHSSQKLNSNRDVCLLSSESSSYFRIFNPEVDEDANEGVTT